jgi:hypothetical protein
MRYENKILVLPDVHTKFEKAQRIINKFKKTHKFVMVGDYFDQFGDTPEINQYTAHWLKTTMNEHPDWVYLMGNHDVHYHPHFTSKCSGYSSEKNKAINTELSIDDWNKLKYFHFENGYWFSHAGITKYWFQHPMHETINVENLQSIIDKALIKLKSGDDNNAIYAASFARGGSHIVGGITWADHREMDLIPNMKQIYGHTPIKHIHTIRDDAVNAQITNVDTSGSGVYFSELLEIDEMGHTNIIQTGHI